MTLAELKAAYGAALDAAGELAEATDFDQKAVDGKLAEAKNLKAQIDSREAINAARAAVSAPEPRKANASAGTPARDDVAVSHNHITATPAIERDPMFGFADVGEFGLAVAKACRRNGAVDDRLAALQNYELNAAPASVHVEQGSDNGYMVPAQIREGVMNLVMGDETSILSLAAPEPTSGNEVKQSTDETTPWGSTGVQSYWASENSAFTPSSLVTKQVAVPLHKIYAFVNASEELLEDTALLASRLNQRAPEAINYKASDAIVNGDGVGKPLGFANAASLVSQAKETSQTADTINASNIAKMYSRLQGSKRGAVWLIHPDAFPQLPLMTLGDQPIWTPPVAGFTRAPSGMLLGLPVYESEHCQTVGDAGDIYLWQPAGYGAYQKQGGIKFATSMHLYFDYDVQAFRWTFRIGGRPYLSAAVTPDNGSSTRSHQVSLAARA